MWPRCWCRSRVMWGNIGDKCHRVTSIVSPTHRPDQTHQTTARPNCHGLFASRYVLAIINLIKSVVALLLKKDVQLANLYMKVLMRVILRVSKLVQMISPLSLQFHLNSFRFCVYLSTYLLHEQIDANDLAILLFTPNGKSPSSQTGLRIACKW